MADKKINKKTAEEGKNVKDKKENSGTKKSTSSNTKTNTTNRDDVNSDVDQE